MEDSYTVHRRRKAAAKRREKTPEPYSRNQLVETSDDEGQSRRARMEKMADDAEQEETEKKMKQEELRRDSGEKKAEEPRRQKSERSSASRDDRNKTADTVKASVPSEPSTRQNEAKDKISNLASKETPTKSDEFSSNSWTRDSDAKDRSPVGSAKETPIKTDESSGNAWTRDNDAKDRPVKGITAKTDEVSKASADLAKERHEGAIPRFKEIDGDAELTAEPRKVERRLKKKSRERVQRHGPSSDSSDAEDTKRHKSPEGSRIRMKKTSAKKFGSPEPDAVKKESIQKPTREKKSKHKMEPSEDPPKATLEGHSRGYSKMDDTDEDLKTRKTESIPRQTTEVPVLKRSPSDVKKLIIPLSNDSLIQDFARAQNEYLKRGQSILAPETPEDSEDVPEEPTLRRRKFSMLRTESEHEEIVKLIEAPKEPAKKSWFSWLPSFGRKKESTERKDEEETKVSERIKAKFEEAQLRLPEKVTFMDFLRALKDVVAEFKAFVVLNPGETLVMRNLRNRCLMELLLAIIYCGLGAFVFRFTEGAFETFYKCGVKRVKRDFLDSLWNYSHNLREDDWKSMARKKLMEFEEQLHTAHEAGVHTYSGQTSWTFLNSVVYCLTVITTIGYGHISPTTTTGRAITIVYAIFGIPMFLIILADFGKLFTRGIKFLWAFVRRLYYTGSCRKVRRTGPVQEVMKGVQLVYDFATFKRPSQINPEDIEEIQKQAQQQSQAVLNLDGNVPDTPGTPAMSAFAIDDEFNLPISVAIFILLGYIFIGATLFCLSEGWGFFESFYFVFISMSTIGFGDYVPKHPIYMMCSIIYLVFGLALTSMCINVVQVMLSDSFRQASQKIGATIGFEVAEEDGSVNPAVPPAVEVADVHINVKESENDEKIAPKAKQEDVDL